MIACRLLRTGFLLSWQGIACHGAVLKEDKDKGGANYNDLSRAHLRTGLQCMGGPIDFG
jgi:hypothetical protein